MSEIKQIEPNNWQKFLEDFSARNKNRRARFQVFRGKSVENEAQEAHLEKVSLNDKTITITRLDRTKEDGEKIHDTVTNVIGIAMQYDTDGNEDVLEITDKENELISLRMESRIDGAS